MRFIRSRGSIIPRPILYLFVLFIFSAGVALAQPVVLGVETSTGTDTLVRGRHERIIFTMDSDTIEVAAATWPIKWSFSNGNIIGPIRAHLEVFWSVKAQLAFENQAWNPGFGNDATDPDTTLCGVQDFGGGGWTGSGEVWYVLFIPSDIGTITIDSLFLIGNQLEVLDGSARGAMKGSLPLTWSPKTIHVLDCPVLRTGDTNGDGIITSADIISIVLAVFKCDFQCIIPCWAAGDTNCNGAITSADIIVLVNYIFKSGDPPCDVCPLIWDGAWTCP